jgi:glycosyltransferase involved in cell wall biosynthesis
LTRRPYTVFTYESTAFKGRLTDLLSNQSFDLLHVDSLDLSGYLSGVHDVPIICDHHNVESALLRVRAQREGTGLRRCYLNHQAALLEREERRWCNRLNLNLTVSSKDREDLLRISPGARVTVVPNGVDTTAFRPTYDGDLGVVFVGGLTWFPNRDALEYFAERILPLIRGRMGSVPVCWVGRASPPVVDHYWRTYGIKLTGFVDDIRPFVEPAACFVVPLRVGGGTRLKILDAWAMGKAVVSTAQGCEGLDARDGENILIRNSDTEFAAAVGRVLDDEELRLRLGRAGRATAEETYDWQVVGRKMLGEFRQLLRNLQVAERPDPLQPGRTPDGMRHSEY